MKINIALLAATVFTLSLGGCAYSPEKDAPQATLHIVTDHPHLTTSVWMYDSDPHCSSGSAMLGSFSKLYDGEKKVQLEASKTKYLIVKTFSRGLAVPGSCGGGVCIKDASCVVEFEVTPVAGRIYRAKHSGNGQTCSVQITDELTGVAPVGIRQLPLDGNCK